MARVGVFKKEDFINEAKKMIKEYLPDEYQDAEVVVQKVSKVGETYQSLTVRKPGQRVAPAANLDAFYSEYQSGKAFHEVMRRVAEVIQTKAPDCMVPPDIKWLMDYEQVKQKLFVRICNADTNQELARTCPHKILCEDLMMTVHIVVAGSDNSMATTVVQNELMSEYGISEEQLFEDALKNSASILPAKIGDMSDIIPIPNIFTVVSNEKNASGAAVLFYPGVAELISRRVGGDYIILPSSIHEVLVLPDDGNYEYSIVMNMVSEVNETVDPRERLSGYIYHYDSEAKVIERIDTYVKRTEATA